MVNATPSSPSHTNHHNGTPVISQPNLIDITDANSTPQQPHITSADAQAPHHTLAGLSDDSENEDDGDADSILASDQNRDSDRSDIKVIQQIRVDDYVDAEGEPNKHHENDKDDDQISVLADDKSYSSKRFINNSSKANDEESVFNDPLTPGGNRFEDEDDDTRASLIAAEGGFSDRRGTRLRRKAPSSIISRFWEIAREALPTLVVSLLSLMFSGELLVHLARWPVFQKVDKLFILIPILLNMKGNLEMNLSLRMSTSANIGELDVRRTRETLIRGNMALLQVQALIVSSFAGVLAFVLGVATPEPQTESPVIPIPPRQEAPSFAAGSGTPENVLISTIVRSAFSAVTMRQRKRGLPASTTATSAPARLQARRIIHHHPKPPVDPALRLRNGYFEFVLVIATGMLSASLSSAILGSFMCALVVIARRAGANPDNIASPLAASLGDLTTLTLLGLLASTLVHFEGTFLATLILAGLVMACIACFIVTYRNAYVRELLTSGWVPLLVAMFISSGAGLVLDNFVLKFEGFGLLAPVISGLPGACAAIFASRITTALHSGKGSRLIERVNGSASGSGGKRKGVMGLIGTVRGVMRVGPIEGWFVPFSLLVMGVSIKTIFIVMIRWSSQMEFGWVFGLSFIVASVVANGVGLYLGHIICLFLWVRDYDPDIYCLPFVSSIVDVVGQSLLVLTYTVATAAGDHITAAVNAGAGHGGL